VGYSLGGLVARYAIGLLGANGILDELEPMVGRSLLRDVSHLIANAIERILQPFRLHTSEYGRPYEDGTITSGTC
jgi:hypothetical protein